MLAFMAQRLISELKTLRPKENLEIPEIIEKKIPKLNNKLRIYAYNLNFNSSRKFLSIKNDLIEGDIAIAYLIECWTEPDEIAGYIKYVYPSKYVNTLYIRNDINHYIDTNGLNGFTVSINKQDINFVYIPPDLYMPNLPNGLIIGDLNWKSTGLDEPQFHENNTRTKRTGMSVVNALNDPIFEFFDGSDHDMIKYDLDLVYEKSTILDKFAVPRQLYKAAKTKYYEKPLKYRQNNTRIRYYNTMFWIKRSFRPKCSKIFNSNLFGKNGMAFWKRLYNFEKKQRNDMKSKVNLDNCYKIKSNAADTNGISVNLLLKLLKPLNKLEKENILIAIKNDNLINSLLLKKREFNRNRYDPNDFRMICILPTYMKLVEMSFDNKEIENIIKPNFVGFMKGQSVHSLISLLNKYANH